MLNRALFSMIFSSRRFPLGDGEAFEAEVCDSSWERFLLVCNGCDVFGSLSIGGDCCNFPGSEKGEPVVKL